MTTRHLKRDPYRGVDPRELPAYDTSTAAHYLRLPENTLRNWAFGYTHGAVTAAPLIHVADAQRVYLSFSNLVELHVLAALRREHRVQLKSIRAAIDYLQTQLDTARPLLDRTMETDGTSIFVERLGSLVNASKSGQLAMRTLLHAYLKRIDRDTAGAPMRLFPFTRAAVDDVSPRIVAIDPGVAFGRPVILGSRVPTREVFDRYRRGETTEALARDFGRAVEEIDEAIRCEIASAA